MSSVLSAPVAQTCTKSIQLDPLLEHFYTYYGVNQLHDMLDSPAAEDALSTWRVTEQEYRSTLRAAINLVIND